MPLSVVNIRKIAEATLHYSRTTVIVFCGFDEVYFRRNRDNCDPVKI